MKSVQVADGQTVTYGVTASSIGTGLMQEIQNIANFDAGGTGNFSGSTSLSQAQNNFLTGEISARNTVGHQSQQCHGARMAMPITAAERGQPAKRHVHALFGFHLEYPGHQHGQRRHPVAAEPDRAAGGACRSPPRLTS